MSPSLTTVNLATLALGTLFYGMYLVLFFISMYLLLRRYNATHTSHKLREDISVFTSTVFVSAICLFIVVTAHWTSIVYRAFFGFVVLQGGFNEAEAFFIDRTQPTEIIQNALMGVAIVIGDSLIIHRLWVVSRSKLMIVVPVASVTAFAVTSAILTFYWHSSDVFANPLMQINALLTLLVNVYCTVCITWKIWTVTRVSMPSDGTSLRHFVVIIVESAGLYAIWAVFFAVTYQVQSNLQLCVIQTAPAVIGIANALIHTRVGLGWTSEQTKGMPSEPSSPLMFAGGHAIED
ncbi:hypothetical protein K438DRAFT_1841292 [Mycena galopus ATCC 62051]|nr:hypothetical protein K438DRAFT_1841292 [Mycena galopus ATCC 62051]